MIELLRDILTSPFGSFSFIFGLLVLSGWLIFFITKKVTEIKTEHSELSKTFEKAESRWGMQFIKIENNIDDIRRDLSYLKGTINVLKDPVNPYAKRKSPISLTDEGIKVVQELNADNIIVRNWEKIYECLEKNVFNKNAYDIQEYCMFTASVEPELFFEQNDVIEIKNYAYKNGHPLQVYMQLIGILIRDRYLKEKGINLTDIDKHDPNKNQ
jgi:hypothetical protein